MVRKLLCIKSTVEICMHYVFLSPSTDNIAIVKSVKSILSDASDATEHVTAT